MILAHITHPSIYQPLTGSLVWLQALDWINTHAHAATQGVHELRGQDMFVNVHEYDTLPVDQCRFESHRRFVDLHKINRDRQDLLYNSIHFDYPLIHQHQTPIPRR